jgi:hypothetical protein
MEILNISIINWDKSILSSKTGDFKSAISRELAVIFKLSGNSNSIEKTAATPCTYAISNNATIQNDYFFSFKLFLCVY